MRQSKFFFVFPLALFALFVFSKFWLFALGAFLLMKFSFGGCGRRRPGFRRRFSGRAATEGEQNTSTFDERDIVPDGQSGF